jgi:nucleoid-associated protein YgaU
MGRETKLLLGFLGLLAGAFVGVLSVKLFVPRPPAGAGPDINTDPSFVERHDLVEPPAPALRAWDFAAAPPLTPSAASPPGTRVSLEPAAPPAFAAAGRYADRAAGRFGSRDRAAPDPDDHREHPQPAIEPVAWEQPAEAAATGATTGTGMPEFEPPDHRIHDPGTVAAPSAAREPSPSPVPAAVPGVPAGYIVQPGDSWWAVAAAAYGDGRLYRALFAWNRAVDPRVALAPGTRLEIPPLSRLAAAWPRLLPTARPPAP